MPLVEKHRDRAAEDVEEEDAALVDARALLGSRGPSLAGGLRSGTGLAGDGRPGGHWKPPGRANRRHGLPESLSRQGGVLLVDGFHELVQPSSFPVDALALGRGVRRDGRSRAGARLGRLLREVAPDRGVLGGGGGGPRRAFVHRRLGPARCVQRVP